jgi:hypothetical protein
MRSFSEALDARRPSLSAEEEAGMEARMEAERENAKSVVRTVQSTFLIAPLVVLLTLSLVLSAVQWAATLTQIRSSNEDTQGAGNGAGDSKGMLEMLVTTRPVVPGWEDSIKMPTSRLSRTLRFTLFIGLLQWFQQFLGIFPRWYLVLIKFKYSTPLKLALTAVGFPSAIRFLEYVDPHSYSRPPDRAETHAHTRTRTHARTQARTHARARAHTHTQAFLPLPLSSLQVGTKAGGQHGGGLHGAARGAAHCSGQHAGDCVAGTLPPRCRNPPQPPYRRPHQRRVPQRNLQ